MSCSVKKRGKTKNSFLFRSSFFLKSHPTLLFMVLAGCFLLIPGVQFAQAGWFENLTSPTAWINALIYPFFLFFSWIVNLAAGIFVWVINAETFTKLMNAGAIYEVWLIVRDFLNIFFILVLLFSAFATIFQLDKYEYKRTIPMLVIMALLVNFSFPVARFVIDLANVPMYFFSQNIFGVDGPNEITSGILSGTKMQNILIPGVDNNKDLKDFETTHLLAATICMFLFGISFLVLAILMLVRMIALAILVMFSPIGFVGMITPALQSFAKGWWDKLFKWAFYGPIAVMFVLVSVIVMKSAGDSIYPSAGAGGVFQSTGSSVNDNMVSAVAFFTIPIVLFWIAITSTEKYSNDISGLGIKWGSQLGRWGARQARGGSVWTAKLLPKGVDRLSGNRISGSMLGIREAWRNRRGWGGKDMKERQELASARMEGRFTRGGSAANAERDYINKKAREIAEENKKNGRLENDVRADLQMRGDDWRSRARRKAAAMTLSERELLTGTPETTTLPDGRRVSDFEAALVAAGDDLDLVASITKKAPKEMINNAENLSRAFESVNRTIESAINRMPNANQQDIEARNRERIRLRDRTMGALIEKSSGGALAGDSDQMRRIVASFGGDADLERVLTGKMKKEGKIKNLIDYRINEFERNNPGQGVPVGDIYEEVIGKYSGEELGKQSGLMGDVSFQAFFRDKMNRGAFSVNDYNRFLRFAEGTTDEQENFRNFMGRP